MDIKEIKTEFIISTVPDHLKHKSTLLDLIDQLPHDSYQGVSKTDWNLPPDFEKKYIPYFYSHIANSIMDRQQKYLKAQSWEISHTWFQQYDKGGAHPYHNHIRTNFTNVYFLELPNKKFNTSIKVRDKEYSYKVKEGQLITFPAHLLHTSKNNGVKRKTVIAFNSDFLF